MSLEVTAEKAQQSVEVILNLLGNPTTPLHREALEAFHSGKPEHIKFLSMANPEDHFCRALNYLVSVPKLTPNTFTILAESLRAAGDHVRQQVLLDGGKTIQQIFQAGS